METPKSQSPYYFLATLLIDPVVLPMLSLFGHVHGTLVVSCDQKTLRTSDVS